MPKQKLPLPPIRRYATPEIDALESPLSDCDTCGASAWLIYIIACSDHSLYTGITTDIQRRFSEHASGKGGAKYFRGRRPERVVYLEACENRSVASRREYQLKRLNRGQKLDLIEQESSH